MKPEEKRKSIIAIVLLTICWILATYFLHKEPDTCRDSLIASGFFLLMALIGYWQLGERRKESVIYLYYLLLLMLVLYIVSIIDNGCFSG
ncbi:MAG: hypothetical protein HXS46_03945 [Theionarchaea archaeon]|nr:hypothetical protein [Theionarchaea archaeon]